MATYFVSNAGSNTAPYDTEAKAATSLATIAAVPWTASDTVKVSSTHTESAGAAINYTLPTSAGLRIVSVAFNGSGTGAATAGGSIAIGAASAAISIASGYAYIFGLTMTSGTNNNNSCDFNIVSAAAASAIYFDTCTLSSPSVASGAIFQLGYATVSSSVDCYISFSNVVFDFGASSGKSIVLRAGRFDFDRMSLTGTAPTTLFTKITANASNVKIVNSNLSGLTWTNLVDVSTVNDLQVRLRQCKLPSGYTIITGSVTNPGKVVELIDCSSGDNHYEYAKVEWQGTVVADNTVYYDATDGTNSISWLMAGNANTSFAYPLTAPEVSFFNSSTSSMTTTVEVNNDGTTFKDNELWQETAYKGTSGSTQATVNAGDRAASVLSAGANQDSSSVSWTGTGGFGAAVKQKLVSTSFTPAELGPISVTVKLAINDTVYVSPKVLASSSKQWQGLCGMYTNEQPSSGGGGEPSYTFVI